jgi:hypothetical protein
MTISDAMLLQARDLAGQFYVPVAVFRFNQDLTLVHEPSGANLARIRPLAASEGAGEGFEILYWSWRERWTSVAPSGAIARDLEKAFATIATRDVFWSWRR